MTSFAQRIKQLRESQDISREELSKVLTLHIGL